MISLKFYQKLNLTFNCVNWENIDVVNAFKGITSDDVKLNAQKFFFEQNKKVLTFDQANLLETDISELEVKKWFLTFASQKIRIETTNPLAKKKKKTFGSRKSSSWKKIIIQSFLQTKLKNTIEGMEPNLLIQ